MVIKIEEAKEQHYIEVNRLVRQGQDDHVRGIVRYFVKGRVVWQQDFIWNCLSKSKGQY